jgi:P27 family predicted phage terminase small subunit
MKQTRKTPPAILNNSARNYYNTIIRFLNEKGVFESIDFYMVAMAANALALYHEAAKQVAQDGATQKFKTGATNVNGAYTVMKDQVQVFQQLSIRLGLDVKSREKIMSYQNDSNESDPFVALRKLN